MLDIFQSDAFGIVPLTDAFNNLSYIPGRIGQLGIFTETGTTSKYAAIESRGGVLQLIAPTPRGGPGHTLPKDLRTMRVLEVPHFEINDAVMAEEVQGVRAFGTESQLEVLMDRVNERGGFATDSLEVTQEYSRLGAIKGIVTYADGTTMNLFTEFGVTPQATIDFDLDNAAPASGALRARAAGVGRLVASELGGLTFTNLFAFCGDAFFDALIAHKEVVQSYLNTPMATVLRDGYLLPSGNKIYGVFEFGGIIWENYRGGVGATSFIGTDDAYIFPMGVPRLFRTYYAPADYNNTVNTIGRRLYAIRYEMQNTKGWHLDTQMNSLNVCTRPRVLIHATRT